MDKVKISIIVPVYNVEKYLEECVESILNQTFQNFELILIDDGSTDTSGKKCDRLATEHSKIKVIHKKNGGLSSARNCGIEIAIGEYLMFIDSDDFLLNNKCLMKISQYLNDCDVLQYKMKYFYEKHNKYIELKDIYDITKLDKYSDKINKLVCDGCLSISACDKIVLRKFILENKLFFEEGLISEDVHWSLELYTKEPKIKISNICALLQTLPNSIGVNEQKQFIQEHYKESLYLQEKFTLNLIKLPTSILSKDEKDTLLE